MKTLKVDPGVCGMDTIITAEKDGRAVRVSVQSKCPAVCKMIENLKQPLDPYGICFSKPGTGPLYEAAQQYLTHGACVIPSAVIKAIEAEAKLALPRDVSLTFEEN